MRAILLAAVAACLIGPAAFAGPDSINFPEGYQSTFTHYSTVNLADERKQVVKMFGNDVALASAKDGAPLDSGAVVVMEVYKARLEVMETRSGWGEDYPEAWRNGEWEFAAFKPDDHTLVERDYQPCFECHKPLQASEYMFSFDALSKAGRPLILRSPVSRPCRRRRGRTRMLDGRAAGFRPGRATAGGGDDASA